MVKIVFRVIPNSSSTRLIGHEGAVWKIRISAPPIDGKANEELVGFLAGVLDLAPSEIELVKGASSKLKTVIVPMHQTDVFSLFKKNTHDLADSRP